MNSQIKLKRGTTAAIAASNKSFCAAMITSRKPANAEPMQDVATKNFFQFLNRPIVIKPKHLHQMFQNVLLLQCRWMIKQLHVIQHPPSIRRFLFYRLTHRLLLQLIMRCPFCCFACIEFCSRTSTEPKNLNSCK